VRLCSAPFLDPEPNLENTQGRIHECVLGRGPVERVPQGGVGLTRDRIADLVDGMPERGLVCV
jgi:hypothetical protein